MPTSADLLLDTSAAIALVQMTNASHDHVVEHVTGKTLGLAGHAMVETYSVLTRLPGAQRVGADQALALIRHNFPASHTLRDPAGLDALKSLNEAGISGGSVYDGLVALAAREAGVRLLTCDRRALTTYARLGVQVMVA